MLATVSGPAGVSNRPTTTARGSSSTMIIFRARQDVVAGTGTGSAAAGGPARTGPDSGTAARSRTPPCPARRPRWPPARSRPGVPDSAATNRWVTAPMASAATAVRSARWDRGWSRSTSCSARMSGSRVRTADDQPVEVDHPVAGRPAVQQVEGGQPHVGNVPSITDPTDDRRGRDRAALRRSSTPRPPSRPTGCPSPWAGATPSGCAAPRSRCTTWTWWWPRRTWPPPSTAWTAAGFRIERPPEDWLFKAYVGREPGRRPAQAAGDHRGAGAGRPAPRRSRCSGSGSRCCRRPRS